MGLRLAHSIVMAHGGEMRADLHSERGMIYHIILPVQNRSA
jgi:signal transduction histidine kinase